MGPDLEILFSWISDIIQKNELHLFWSVEIDNSLQHVIIKRLKINNAVVKIEKLPNKACMEVQNVKATENLIPSHVKEEDIELNYQDLDNPYLVSNNSNVEEDPDYEPLPEEVGSDEELELTENLQANENDHHVAKPKSTSQTLRLSHKVKHYTSDLADLKRLPQTEIASLFPKFNDQFLKAVPFIRLQIDKLNCFRCKKLIINTIHGSVHYVAKHKSNKQFLLGKMYPCHNCHMEFASIEPYLTHLECFHNDGTGSHQCNLCDLKFHYTGGLKNHIELFHKTVSYKQGPQQCDFCTEYFDHPYTAKLHRFQKHPYLVNSCGVCDKTFTFKHSLNLHFRREHPAHVKSCLSCEFTSTDLEKFEFHQEEVHDQSKTGTYVCDCSKAFSSQTFLDMHIMNKHSKEVHCLHCNKLFKNDRRLAIHVNALHKNKPYTIKCLKCPQKFNNNFSLKYHEDIFHNNGLGTFLCNLCGINLSSPKNLKIHTQRVHSLKVVKMPCNICGQKFSVKYERDKHLFLHHSEKIIECPKCFKQFFDPKNLQQHKRLAHGESFQCRLCLSIQETKESLDFHIEDKHYMVSETEKNFQCSCKKYFSSMEFVRKHEQIHNTVVKKESKHVKAMCPICGKAFTSYYLKRHIESHTAVIKCTLCDYVTNNRDNLHSHMKFTHKAPQLKCSFCSKMFKRPDVLKHHVNTIHLKIRHNCEFCEKSYAFYPDYRSHVKSAHMGLKHKCSFCDAEFGRGPDRNRHVKQVHGDKNCL